MKIIHPTIQFQPKLALIVSPLIPILLFMLYFLLRGSFKLDILQIVGTFAGIYFIILFPALLKLCNLLIAKNIFIFPFMWLGAHITLSLIYFFMTIFQNIYRSEPIFEYVGSIIWHNVFSLFMLIISCILALIFWTIASFIPKLKAKKS